METLLQSLKTLSAAHWHESGGKAGTLVRLVKAGYPVPGGFVILPAAFNGDELLPEAWQQVQAQLKRLRKGKQDIAFAVRSSAMHEDSAQASFAGAFETVLDMLTDQAIREAIHRVRTSRHNARVQAYSQAYPLVATSDLAVVVQQMVKAESLGGAVYSGPGDRESHPARRKRCSGSG